MGALFIVNCHRTITCTTNQRNNAKKEEDKKRKVLSIFWCMEVACDPEQAWPGHDFKLARRPSPAANLISRRTAPLHCSWRRSAARPSEATSRASPPRRRRRTRRAR